MSDQPQNPWPPLARKTFRDGAKMCRQKAAALRTDQRVTDAERAEGIAALEKLAIELEGKAAERPNDRP
jgi:hypothetical protein